MELLMMSVQNVDVMKHHMKVLKEFVVLRVI